jgi:hypothetical protein
LPVKGYYTIGIFCIEKQGLAMRLEKGGGAAQILRESMIDAGKMYLKDVPVLVDVVVVDNWCEK